MRFLCGLICFLLLAGNALGEEKNLYMRVVARDDTTAGQREKMLVRNWALLCWPEMENVEKAFPDCEVTYRFWQPDKNTAPAGTVYITIGQGQGQNWWGVLYPDSIHWAGGEKGEEVHIAFPFFSRLWQWIIHPAEWFAIG